MIAGTPLPGGLTNPFPGSLTMTSQTLPTPSITLGHGGGTRMADIPTGFCCQDLLRLSETITSFIIFNANPVGLLPVNTFLGCFPFVQITVTSYVPAEISAYEISGSPLKDLTSFICCPSIKSNPMLSAWKRILYLPLSGKLTFFHV